MEAIIELEQSTGNTKVQRRIILAASTFILLSGLNSGWIGPVLPTIETTQALSLVEAGSLVSVSGIGSILAIILSKVIVQRFGAKTCLDLGSIIIAAGMVAVAVGSGFGPLLCAVSVLGFGLGLTSVAGSLCILHVCTSNAAPALNGLHLFFGIGALTGPFVASLALSSPWSYRAMYTSGAVIAAAIAVLLATTPNMRPASPSSQQTSSTLAVAQEPALWLYAIVMFLYVGVEVGTATWLFSYLERESHLKTGLASLTMSILWTGLTIGRLVSAFLCSRMPTARVTGTGMAMMCTALCIISFAPNVPWMVLLMVASLGFGCGPVYPNILADSNGRFKGHASTVTPFVITSGSLGGISFPVLTGYIFAHHGFRAGMGTLAMSALVMFIVFGIMHLQYRRHKCGKCPG